MRGTESARHPGRQGGMGGAAPARVGGARRQEARHRSRRGLSSDDSLALTAPTRRELFFGFLRVALSGFGGVLPWARRMMVEEKRWMSEVDFVDLLAISQLLPGPNI